MNAHQDFADWLSPMLVKELRQGMRSRFFVTSFLILQVAMIFVAIIGLAKSGRQEDVGALAGFFWTFVSVPLLLLMPLSGLGAVGNERKANTLELIFLTRLTPRRIITGKWVAIVAQTVLLVCAVLPYSVLRYFLGGVNLATELTTIGILLFASALLSGVAVGFSPQSSRLSRVLLVVGLIIVLQTVPRLLFFSGGWVLSGGRMDWQTYVCVAVSAIIGLLFMIEFGAARIAPLAENHSTSRRLIALAVACGVLVLGRQSSSWAAVLWICAIVLLAPICIGALCEFPGDIPSVYRPFVKSGRLGKFAGRFLYPGWPSGFLFTVLVFACLFATGFLRAQGVTDAKWIWWAGVTVAGALYFPAAMIWTFFPRTRRPFFIYIGIQIILSLVTLLSAVLQSSNLGDIRPLIAAMPLCGLLLTGSKALTDQDFFGVFAGVSLVTATSVVFLLVKMRAPWRQMRTLEKRAAIDVSFDAAQSA